MQITATEYFSYLYTSNPFLKVQNFVEISNLKFVIKIILIQSLQKVFASDDVVKIIAEICRKWKMSVSINFQIKKKNFNRRCNLIFKETFLKKKNLWRLERFKYQICFTCKTLLYQIHNNSLCLFCMQIFFLFFFFIFQFSIQLFKI